MGQTSTKALSQLATKNKGLAKILTRSYKVRYRGLQTKNNALSIRKHVFVKGKGNVLIEEVNNLPHNVSSQQLTESSAESQLGNAGHLPKSLQQAVFEHMHLQLRPLFKALLRAKRYGMIRLSTFVAGAQDMIAGLLGRK